MKKQFTRLRSALFLAIGIMTFISSANAQSFQEPFEVLPLTDWLVANNSDLPGDDWGVYASDASFTAFNGSNYMGVGYTSTSSTAAGATISNWVITPMRTFNNGDVVRFYTKAYSAARAERLEVRFGAGANPSIGTTAPTSVGDFNSLLLTINPTLTPTGYPTTWTQYTVTISGLSAPTVGRIALRYHVTNGGAGGTNSNFIGIDHYTYTAATNPVYPSAPANDNCAGATNLTPSTTCNPTSGTTAGATQSQVGCTGNANDDVWYKFTATATNAELTVTGSAGFDAVVEAFSGSGCGALVTGGCGNTTGVGEVETGNLVLTIGTTYYVRVYDAGTAPTSSTFTICVKNTSTGGTPPANDNCTGAIALTPSTTCSPVTGTTLNATQSLVGCEGNANDDVWYKFVATASTGTVTVVGSSGFDAVLEFFTGTCTGLSAGGCLDATAGGGTEMGSLTGLTPGQTYYIRIYDYQAAATTNTFTVCVVQTPSSCSLTAPAGAILEGETCGQHTNSSCATAATLTCGQTVFGNVFTASTGPGTATRDTDWYKFTIAAPGTVSWTVNAEFPFNLLFIDITDCNNPVSITGISDNVPCQPATLTYNFPAAGTYVAWVGPTPIVGPACGLNNDYIATLTLPSTPATLNYPNTSICVGSANVTPTTSGAGTFTASPSGLVFVSTTTGQINATTSAPGTYTVTFTPTGACAGTPATQTITITTGGASTVNYPSTSICVGGANVTPTTTGGTGTFSASPAGLVFVSTTTGQINATTSTPGTYTVTFTPTGACAGTPSTQTITITTGGASSVNYPTTSICVGGANVTPTTSGTGTFSASPAGLAFVSTTTGQINAATSAPGTYTVTFTPTGACAGTPSTQTIVINPGTNAAFNYASASICGNAANITPTSASAGTFSASPSGLVFANTITGEINVSASAAGTYTITHTVTGTCGSTATQTITITVAANANFNYPSNTICVTGGNVTPTGATGTGTYTATPSGLVFVNTSTGQINASASTPGTYTITRTIGGTCGATSTQTITISAGNAAFNYLSGSLCAGSANVTPTSAETGVFTATPSGLVFADNTSGEINVAASAAGTYTITHTTNGACVATATQTIVIISNDASFTFASNTICTGSANVTPVSVTAAGTYSATPAGLVFANTTTGQINVSGSTPGTYSVTHTTTGTCASTATQQVTITSNFAAGFSYPNSSYCAGSSNPSPVFAASASAGTFTASPAGLSINAGTGVINLTASAPGIYTVTNTISASGSCASESANTSVIVLAKPTAVVSGGGNICGTGTSVVTITLTGVAPFNFAYTNGTTPVSITGHTSSTYTINATAAGTYTVGSVSDANCVNAGSGSAIVTVSQNPAVTMAALSTLCSNGTAVTLTQGSPAGGTYSGAGVNAGTFNPAAAPSGTVITYTYTDANGCSGTASAPVTIETAPVVTMGALSTLCNNGTAVTLTQGSPAGGTYSGTGVTAGSFDPVVAPTGTVITYSFTSAGGCTNTASTAVTIEAAPVVTLAPLADACTQTAAYALSGGLPAGGTYSGPGVTAGNFDPTTAGTGTHNIVYTAASAAGCTNTATAAIFVEDCASLTENEISTSLSVYPNPAHGTVTVAFSSSIATDAAISMVSLDGKIVYTNKITQTNQFNQDIDIAEFPNGIYLINIQTAHGTETRRITVQ